MLFVDWSAFEYSIESIEEEAYSLAEKREVPKSPITKWADFLLFVKNAKGWENRIEKTDFEAVLPVIESLIEALVHDMGDPCQTILTQSYWNDKKDKEISEYITTKRPDIKEMNESAVKTKRWRCIDTLRKLIFNQPKGFK